ncbi:MAG: hypothetical protein J2P21_31450 [Chloracidobacterium sp.]|nr:hypothetical protein [Chloracidobacterium sp.]
MAKQGVNDFKRDGYGGLWPTARRSAPLLLQTYTRALNGKLQLKAKATKKDLLCAWEGSTLCPWAQGRRSVDGA